MFEIGFPELILIAVVGLLVIGPERLPEALRTLGLWVGRMRRSFTNVKAEIEKEIGMDEIRRQLHNEAVMEEMKRIERDVRHSVNAGASADSAPSAEGTTGPTGTESASAEQTIAPPSSRPQAAQAPESPPGDGQAAADRTDDDRHG